MSLALSIIILSTVIALGKLLGRCKISEFPSESPGFSSSESYFPTSDLIWTPPYCISSRNWAMSPFETITTDYSLILMSLELIGVVKVMPNAVKATDNGGLRSHKSIAHPNCKYRILLPKRLTGSNLHIGLA